MSRKAFKIVKCADDSVILRVKNPKVRTGHFESCNRRHRTDEEKANSRMNRRNEERLVRQGRWEED